MDFAAPLHKTSFAEATLTQHTTQQAWNIYSFIMLTHITA